MRLREGLWVADTRVHAVPESIAMQVAALMEPFDADATRETEFEVNGRRVTLVVRGHVAAWRVW